MGKNLIWLNYGGIEKEVNTLRLISRFFGFFILPVTIATDYFYF